MRDWNVAGITLMLLAYLLLALVVIAAPRSSGFEYTEADYRAEFRR